MNYSKPADIIPLNDEARLKKLQRYEILDTPSETDFDTIALLASSTFETESAFVNFVDRDSVFFKANISPLSLNKIARTHSLCALTILEDDIIVFHDTHQFPELANSPYLSSAGEIRFYAGAPLRTADGYTIGTVCVTDKVPHLEVTERQLNVLRLLSKIVMEKLETRLNNRKIVRAYDDTLHRLVHDMKNPITSISLYAQLLGAKELAPEKVSTMANKIEKSARDIEKNLNNLLTDARNENSGIELSNRPVAITLLLDQLQQSFELSLSAKKQRLIVSNDLPVFVNGDKERLQDVFDNLLSNAIKYSHRGATIIVSTSMQDDNVIIEFKDNGLGLNEEDMGKLFLKFARLSSVPTASERSDGLGLSIVKMLVERHKGKVWARSDGKNKGSSFFVSLPKSKMV